MNELILIVDDNDLVRKLLNAFLEAEGYRVLEARSAAEARASALEQSLDGETIDVVIVDLVLPDGGGSALVDDLKRSSPLLRCLFMSGYSHAPVEARFIAKPFRRPGLLAALELVLNEDIAGGVAV